MKMKISDIFDYQKANILLEGFTKSTGFVTAIVDLDGNILSKSGWRQICTDFHRKNSQTASNCAFSDTELANQIRKDEKYHFYKCVNGLIDVGLPIVIKGEHIANIFSGQFLFEEPDISFFKKQAQKYGFDEQAYIEALRKVPIVSKEYVEVIIHFLVDITQMIIEMTAEKLELTKLNQEFKKSQSDLIVSQEELGRNLKDLMESQRIARMGTWRQDLTTDQVVWSEQLYKMYGFDPTLPAPSYTEHMKLFTPESWKELSTSLDLTRTTGTPFELELETITKDGSNGWMWVRGEAEKDPNGNITSLRGAARDITGRKIMEKKLRHSEERFRVAQEISPDGFTILHPVRNETGEIIDFTWVYENKAIALINQTDPHEIIGKRLLDLFPDHNGTIIFEAYKHVSNTGETKILDEINVGEIISKPAWLRLAVVSMGEDIAIHTQDITERKEAEKTSKENVFRFQSLFNEMSAGAAIYKVLNDGQYGKDYIIRDFNKAALKAEGKEKTEVLGKSLYDIRPNIDEYGLIPVFQKVWKTGEPAYYPTKIYVDDKFCNWYENRVYKLPSGEIVAIFQDVTEKSLAEEAVKKQNDLFVSLLKILPVGVLMVDSAEGKPLVVNETGKALLGSGILPDANEHNLSEVYKAYKGDTQKQYPANEMPVTLGMKGIKSHIDDMVVERPDGSRILLEVFGTPVNDAQGKPWASLVTFMDVTDRKNAENELLYLSYHDHLTGLYNRRYFEQELKNLDTPENLPLSIIMFDVNGLKLVNDSFGHDLGDILLKKSAEAIKKACREKDIAARIGGDEFVILLPKTTAGESLQISNQIKELASNEKVANMELSISYGYDTKKTDKQSIIEIIANAENHMYRHKLYERSSIRSKITDLIMNTLFEKSNREAAHSNRVSSICQSIASKMNMSKDAVNKMKIAGLIHDIGKIGVDESILNKPGSLTLEERSFIERHPEIGWRLLSSTDEFSELAKFVLSHHENWDGTGYPNGLKGEAIPLEARIISVADAYDAMTSERSYRNKLSKEGAVKELKMCSGTQFDPEIVDVFINQVLSDDIFR